MTTVRFFPKASEREIAERLAHTTEVAERRMRKKGQKPLLSPAPPVPIVQVVQPKPLVLAPPKPYYPPPPFYWNILVQGSAAPIEEDVVNVAKVIRSWSDERKKARKECFRGIPNIIVSPVAFHTKEFEGISFPGLKIMGGSEYVHDVAHAMLFELTARIVEGLGGMVIAEVNMPSESFFIRRKNPILMAAE